LIEKADNTNELGDLIMYSATVAREQAQIEGGENFSELVVGCLRKAYEDINSDPSAKTQKCKKNLQKTLMLLEKDLLDKLKEMGQLNEDIEE